MVNIKDNRGEERRQLEERGVREDSKQEPQTEGEREIRQMKERGSDTPDTISYLL